MYVMIYVLDKFSLDVFQCGYICLDDLVPLSSGCYTGIIIMWHGRHSLHVHLCVVSILCRSPIAGHQTPHCLGVVHTVLYIILCHGCISLKISKVGLVQLAPGEVLIPVQDHLPVVLNGAE